MWRERDASRRASRAGTLMLTQTVAAFFFLTLPWLNPFSPGPMPAVMPWLVTLGSGAFVGLWATRVRLAEVAATAWLAAALLSAVLGVLQYFGATAMFGPWVNSTAMGEAYANLRQRNQFATLTNIGLVALLWWAAQWQPRDRRHVSVEVGLLVAAVVLALGNAASGSRTGLMQLVLLMAMVWMWGAWRHAGVRRVLGAAALAYLVAAWVLPGLAGLDPKATGILARLNESGIGCSSRVTLWRNVLHLIAQKPWLGWGWGELDYAHFVTLYPGPRFCDILDNAHNLPLHLAVELGVPLAVGVCGTVLWLTLRARPWRETDATRQLAWAVIGLILLHSLLEYPLWYGQFQLAVGLCVYLLWATPQGSANPMAPMPPPDGHSRRSPALIIRRATAVFVMAVTAYVAWDYLRISQIYLIPKMRSEAYRDHTLEKVRNSWLFQNQVRFAELTTTPLTTHNAAKIRDLATAVLHFSPEPRVIEKLIKSNEMLGHDDEALYYRERYQAAFPESHARWAGKKMP